jgi:hypothetical protein
VRQADLDKVERQWSEFNGQFPRRLWQSCLHSA